MRDNEQLAQLHKYLGEQFQKQPKPIQNDIIKLFAKVFEARGWMKEKINEDGFKDWKKMKEVFDELCKNYWAALNLMDIKTPTDKRSTNCLSNNTTNKHNLVYL